MTVTSKEIYSLLVEGYMPSEIKRKYNLTEIEWRRITARVEFVSLLFSPNVVPDLMKIKEIETALFNLLDISNPSQDVKRRIKSLQVRYSQFLVS